MLTVTDSEATDIKAGYTDPESYPVDIILYIEDRILYSKAADTADQRLYDHLIASHGWDDDGYVNTEAGTRDHDIATLVWQYHNALGALQAIAGGTLSPSEEKPLYTATKVAENALVKIDKLEKRKQA